MLLEQNSLTELAVEVFKMATAMILKYWILAWIFILTSCLPEVFQPHAFFYNFFFGALI